MSQPTSTRSLRIAPLLVALAVVTPSCSGNPEADSASTPSGSGLDDATLAQKSPTRSNVAVDDKLASLCKIAAPKFAFNSESVKPDWASSLDALATCFVSGPGKGKAMNLVGYADPRGETMYNFGLGQRRAAAVAGYLQRKGVAEPSLRTSSRGETESTGTDESSWAEDRRVEIRLAD